MDCCLGGIRDDVAYGRSQDPPRAWPKTSNLASPVKEPKNMITSLVKQWRGDRTIAKGNRAITAERTRTGDRSVPVLPTNIERIVLRVVSFLSKYYQGTQVKRLLLEGGIHET